MRQCGKMGNYATGPDEPELDCLRLHSGENTALLPRPNYSHKKRIDLVFLH